MDGKYIVKQKGDVALLSNQNATNFWETKLEIENKIRPIESPFFNVPEVDQINLHLAGIPYSLGSQFPNSSVGRFPDTLRLASQRYPVYLEYGRKSTSGIYDYFSERFLLQNIMFFDHGNLTLEHNPNSDSLSTFLSNIRFERKEKTGIIGGDHYITYVIVKKIIELLNRPLLIIQFDAHHDCGSEILRNDQTVHHANFIRFLLREEKVKKVIQIGVRGLRALGQRFEDKEKLVQVSSHRSSQIDLESMIAAVKEEYGEKLLIYISMDVDVLNPAEFSLVDFPKQGGLSTFQVIQLLQSIRSFKHHLVGFDMVEGQGDGNLNDYDNILQILIHMMDLMGEE